MSTLERILARHKTDPSPYLGLEVPLQLWLDLAHVRHLATDLDEAMPDGLEVRRATESAHKSIPSEPGLYFFIWAPVSQDDLPHSSQEASALLSLTYPQFVLYVGQAGASTAGNGGQTLRSRYQNEYRHLVGANPECFWDPQPKRTRQELLRHWLALQPLEYWFGVVPDRSRIAGLEKRLIHLFRPPGNQQDKPALQSRVTSRPAF